MQGEHSNRTVVSTAKSTGKFYARIIRSLSMGLEPADEAGYGAQIAGEINSRKLSHNSRKVYSAAVRSWMLDASFGNALDSFEKIVQTPSSRRKGTGRTVVKFVPTEVRDALFAALAIASRRYSSPLLTLLLATEATAVRPCEWRRAQIVDRSDSLELVVMNAKFKPVGSQQTRSAIPNSRRANGKSRTLIVAGSEGEQEILDALLRKRLRDEAQYPWASFARSYRRELKTELRKRIEAGEIAKMFLPVSIYSFRHQAAADAKRGLGVGSGRAAATLGHASVRTAVRSYGRPARGGTGLSVLPSDDSVLLVDNLDLGNDYIAVKPEHKDEDLKPPAPQ